MSDCILGPRGLRPRTKSAKMRGFHLTMQLVRDSIVAVDRFHFIGSAFVLSSEGYEVLFSVDGSKRT